MAAIELVICMGSACFSRGNRRTLELVQGLLKERGLDRKVRITGTLCQDRCRQGPNLTLADAPICGHEPQAMLLAVEARLAALTDEDQ
jgi:NADH:ubiquinone oxidoreductase subunit E